MFFKKDNTVELAYKIYEYARNETEKLYSMLQEDSCWDIQNKTTFVVTSFIFHFFYYRIILLKKFDDIKLKKIFGFCIQEMSTHVFENIDDRNGLIDICDEIFFNLDILTKNFIENNNKYNFENTAKYFIANVENCKPSEVYDAISIMLLTIHFSSILNYPNELYNLLNI